MLYPKMDYSDQTDKVLVEEILALPHNEEAAAFLLYNRYDPLLHRVYALLTRETFWYDDCVVELFLHLRGRDSDWQPLSTFEWRSSFGSWLKGVARRKFQEVLPRLIENGGRNLSLDYDDSEKPAIQIPDGGEEEYERRWRKVMLMEAIGQLKDDDQRFVILKRLEGYNSGEIALLLCKKWQRNGTVKYNNRCEPVVPDAAYVDVRTQRAKENLRRIFADLQ